MAIKKVYLTQEGARVSAFCQNNSIKVKFLSMGFGSGENYNPSQATKMTDEKCVVPIHSCKRIESNHYKVRSEFSNDILESDLVLREICLYCEDPEKTGEKVMYCYGNAKTDEYDYTETIPAFTTSGNVSTRIFDIDTYVQGDNATYYIEHTGKADIATVQELREDLEQEITDRTDQDNTILAKLNKEIEDRKNVVIDVEHGGTGATSDREAQYNLLNNLEEMKNTITDEFEVVGRFITAGNKTNGAIYKFKALLIWNYIKSKIKSVLGLDETEYKGNSTTATKLKITVIPDGADLNTYTKAGFYVSDTNVDYKNAPTTTFRNFSLEVFQLMDEQYMAQRITQFSNGKIFSRAQYYNSVDGTKPWGDWKEVAFISQLTTAETNAKNLANATGVLAVKNGGTGKTTLKDSANAFLNGLDTGSSTNGDEDYFISQYANGGTETTSFHRRPFKTIWTYIQKKISSELGLTNTAYGGKASTADTATKATQDGSGNNIVDTYATKQVLENKSNYHVTSMKDFGFASKSYVSVREFWNKLYEKFGNNGVVQFSWSDANASYVGTTDTNVFMNGGTLIYTAGGKTNTTWRSFSAIYFTGYGNGVFQIRCSIGDDTTEGNESWAILRLANIVNLNDYVKSLSISGKTITYTKGNNTTGTLTIQDSTYTHPTTSGNKHIPSGGSSGQILKWSADGTAEWGVIPSATKTSYGTVKYTVKDGINFDATYTGKKEYILTTADIMKLYRFKDVESTQIGSSYVKRLTIKNDAGCAIELMFDIYDEGTTSHTSMTQSKMLLSGHSFGISVAGQYDTSKVCDVFIRKLGGAFKE